MSKQPNKSAMAVPSTSSRSNAKSVGQRGLSTSRTTSSKPYSKDNTRRSQSSRRSPTSTRPSSVPSTRKTTSKSQPQREDSYDIDDSQESEQDARRDNRKSNVDENSERSSSPEYDDSPDYPVIDYITKFHGLSQDYRTLFINNDIISHHDFMVII